VLGMAEQKQWLDARDLLRGMNGGVALLMMLAYPMFQDAKYVNGLTLLAGLALALQVHWGLSKQKESADPFVIVLLYYVTTYYTLRVVTLAVFDMSDVFRRFPFGPQDTNYALSFIVACNASMLYGFRLMKKQASLPSYALWTWGDARNVEVFLRHLLLVLSIFVIGSVTGAFDWLSGQFQILRVLIFFLRPTTLFVLVGAYLVVFYHEVPARYFVTFTSLYLLTVFDLIILGSRGQIIYFIEMLALLLIANGTSRIRRKWVFRGLMLTPFLLLVLVVTYNFATLQRSANAKAEETRLEVAADNFYGAITNGEGLSDLKSNVAHILSRVGFLDISAEIIAHEPQYRSVFSASYYAKSFVDNVLTPGFDYYDTPKIAYSLIFKHQDLNQGNPSKSYLLENNLYHSDQLGVYGEMYVLFGWYSLPLLFLFAYFLKWVYWNLCVAGNAYEEMVRKVVVLAFFVNIINSFGFDWVVVQTIPFVLTASFLIIYLKRVASQKSHEASV
jgi:hypothetical protein